MSVLSTVNLLVVDTACMSLCDHCWHCVMMLFSELHDQLVSQPRKACVADALFLCGS